MVARELVPDRDCASRQRLFRLKKENTLQRQSYRGTDPLANFSHRLVRIKIIVVEIVVFLGFILFVWGYVRHQLGLDGSSVQQTSPQQFERQVAPRPEVKFLYLHGP
jgi:hypothetical protein